MKWSWLMIVTVWWCWQIPLPAESPGTNPNQARPGQPGPSVPRISAGFPFRSGGAQDPFRGSQPAAPVQNEELPLSLTDAVQDGLRHNLGAILRDRERQSAEGVRRMTRSALMPRLTASLSESLQKINLEAFGFTGFPGVPTMVGPFSVADARLRLSQPVVDLHAKRLLRASSESLKAAGLSYRAAREYVVLVVTSLYLRVIAGSSRVEAAQAQVETAGVLYEQAVTFKAAGTVPKIVVLRAQVQLHSLRQRLIVAKTALSKQKLDLARAIGLAPGQAFRLTSRVVHREPPAVAIEDALGRAYRARADYQSAAAGVRAAEARRKAVTAERLPSLWFQGDFGAIGRAPARSHGTFAVAGTLEIPVFQGGRIQGEAIQATAELEQQRARLEDLRAQIEHEIRVALLDLRSGDEEVAVARSARELAHQELVQAQDRFDNGVTDNVEVVQAQQSVATADEGYISSLYRYNLDKIILARALGDAESQFQELLVPGEQ